MTNKPTTEIGARIRKARKTMGLSQAELAQRLGVTQATIQKIETSRSTNSRYLAKVVAGVGLPLEELDPVFKSVSLTREEQELVEWAKTDGAATASDPIDQIEDTLIDLLRQVRALRKQTSRLTWIIRNHERSQNTPTTPRL
jgi:transcriptional regulator with XRE-family HTH domain